MRRAYTNSYIQSQKMLASTVQFSTYDQSPSSRPRRTRDLPEGDTAVREQESPDREKRPTPEKPPGRPALSGPNSVPTTPHPRRSAFHTPPRRMTPY